MYLYWHKFHVKELSQTKMFFLTFFVDVPIRSWFCCFMFLPRLMLVILSSITLALAHAPDVKPKALDSVLKQIPTDPKAAAEQAEHLAKNVPAAPLPAGSTNLDVLRDRAANLRKQQEAYLKNVAEGGTRPFPEIAEARPQHEKDVATLTQSLGTIAAEKDPLKRETLSKALFAALQPIGPLLKYADYVKGSQSVLSPDQLAEFKRLEAAWEAAAVNHPPNTPPLSVVGLSELYTVTYLSVPLVVKGAPNSTILFSAAAGGLFSNKLPIIEVKTDATGIATAFWSTQGDAIAECPINLLSPSSPTDGTSFNITTVKLELEPLQGLPTP